MDVIDITPFLATPQVCTEEVENEKAAIVRNVKAALLSTGFIVIKGEKYLYTPDRAFAASASFFRLDDSRKRDSISLDRARRGMY